MYVIMGLPLGVAKPDGMAALLDGEIGTVEAIKLGWAALGGAVPMMVDSVVLLASGVTG